MMENCFLKNQWVNLRKVDPGLNKILFLSISRILKIYFNFLSQFARSLNIFLFSKILNGEGVINWEFGVDTYTYTLSIIK